MKVQMSVRLYPRDLQPTAAWYEYFLWCCCIMYGTYVIVDYFNLEPDMHSVAFSIKRI